MRSAETNPRCQVDIVAVQLTCENVVRHETRFAGDVIIPVDEGGFNRMGGGMVPPFAAKSKTCGLALAMVAIFCYFPGISLVASIGADGVNSQTSIGIAFMSVAGALTVISIVFCIRGRQFTLKSEGCVVPKTPTFRKPLLTNHHECCTGSHYFKHQKGDALCECDEIRLANKIERSLTLKRYFANLDTANGPFDLDHDGMDRATESSLHCPPYSPIINAKTEAKRAEESSIDSAIFVDSDSPLEEGATVL